MMLLGLLAVAGAVAVLAPRADAPAAAPSPVVPAEFYGLNAQLAFDVSAERQWPATAAQIARVGVGVVRRDAFWSTIEPTPPRAGRHRYRWGTTDRLVAALAASRLRWYPIVDYGVAWASAGSSHNPPTPRRVRDYGDFAGALAARYGPHGRFWRLHPRLPAMPIHDYEVWNEPNAARFWSDQANAPARLAAMYLAARNHVRAVDRSARVVLGGLSAIGVDGFLTRMVQARPELVGQLDAVGFHPYGGGPNGGLQVTYERIRALRATLDRLFPRRRVPIEITETGWAVPPVPEAWRAARLQQLALELPRSNCDVTRLIVHTWTSLDAGTSSEAWFGIAHPDGSLSPSGVAFEQAIALMRSPQAPTAPVQIC